ncbi:MAG: carbamoyltransferase C-terminal domain-containing protein [Deltaproteobacteria bacterium]|nr:carbamoyltransferase C-terminal domain-containing protein [Deltaproteobacteria bacterium]
MCRFKKQDGSVPPCSSNITFNVRGEPMVCTPEDSFRCFMRIHMDTLVLGNHLFFLVLTPMHFIAKLFGQDLLEKKWSKPTRKNYEKQF